MFKITICILFLFVSFCFSSDDFSSKLNLGEDAPIFFLKALDGNMVSIKDFCGERLRKPRKNKTKYNVIVSFWATYCEPCKKEIPHLIEFAKKNRSDVKLILISIDKEGMSKIQPFVKAMNIPKAVPVLSDKYGKAAEKYGVKNLPMLFIIDKQRKLRFMAKGFQEDVDLEKLLEEKIGMINSGQKTSSSESLGTSVAVVASKNDIAKRIILTSDADVIAQEMGISKEKVNSVKKEMNILIENSWR